MDNTTEKLVDYCASLNYSNLTEIAIHAVKRSLIDAIGCGIGAFHIAPLKALRNIASRSSAQEPATIIGTEIKTTPEMAAVASGAMIRYLDFSDDYFGGSGDTGPHPSDNIGAILAAAEMAGGGGKSLVLGIALAYEVCGQLVDHIVLKARGWDYPIFHSMATALAAGKLLNLSRDQLANSLAMATVANVCLYQTRRGELSHWKAFAGPNGSKNGLFAALMAREDLTGPDEAIEGQAGLMKQLQCAFTLGKLGGGGTPFKVEGTFFKLLPVRYTLQLPILTALSLREKVHYQDLEEVYVYLEKRSVVNRIDHPENWDPNSRETADHSAPYLVGAALVDGAITDATFTPSRYRDPALLALMRKIHIEEDTDYTATFPATFKCRFEAKLKSGECISLIGTNPKGHPANPMNDSDIEEKFLKLVGTVLPGKQSRALLKMLWDIEEMENLAELFSAMRVPA